MRMAGSQCMRVAPLTHQVAGIEGPRLSRIDLPRGAAQSPHVEAGAKLQVLRRHAAWKGLRMQVFERCCVALDAAMLLACCGKLAIAWNLNIAWNLKRTSMQRKHRQMPSAGRSLECNPQPAGGGRGCGKALWGSWQAHSNIVSCGPFTPVACIPGPGAEAPRPRAEHGHCVGTGACCSQYFHPCIGTVPSGLDAAVNKRSKKTLWLAGKPCRMQQPQRAVTCYLANPKSKCNSPVGGCTLDSCDI